MARSMTRAKDPAAGRVAFVELFYDLVFVFAITQLSHLLLHHYTLQGALEAGLLMLAIWWVWMYTTWALNWLDPTRGPVRMMIWTSMLLGLFMSMSVSDAFGERGLAFALSFVAMQLGRSLFTAWAFADQASHRRNFLRIAAWMAASGVFWIAGGLAHGEARLALWIVALGIEYIGPWARYWTPGLGASSVAEWDVRGEHIAERCGLFVIICLGETLLINGATFAEMEWTGPGIAAFPVNFLGSVAMWWLYFHIGHERGARAIEHSEDPGRIARVAFTYAHLPIIAGIVVSAVAAELIIAHPLGHTGWGVAASILGGPALFLVGNHWFKALTARWQPLSHLVGIGLFALSLVARPVAVAARARRAGARHPGAGGGVGVAFARRRPARDGLREWRCPTTPPRQPLTGPTSPASSSASSCSWPQAWWRCRCSAGSASGRCSATWQPALVIGPFGLGLVSDSQTILHVAELGVVLFLFVIGLEMQPSRLWAMRGEIFGLGVAQVGVCMLLLWTVGLTLGYPLAPSLIAGTGFVLTSTAIVMQMLEERGDDQPAQGPADHRHPAARGPGDRAAAGARRLPRARRRGRRPSATGWWRSPSASRRSRRWSRPGAGCSTPCSAFSPAPGRAR